MAEFPALPLFTDAFISDTVHLTATQTGAYLMLLMCAWRTADCRLPDDDVILSRYARMDIRSWNKHKQTIMSFWKKDNLGLWYQGRLDDERKFVDLRRRKNVEAGKISALKRHNTRSTTVATEGQRKSNEPLTLNPSSKKERVTRKTLAPEEYAFNGKVIKLSDKDYDAWFEDCSLEKTKFYEYLDGRDEWLSQNPQAKKNWFMSTKADLQKRFPI